MAPAMHACSLFGSWLLEASWQCRVGEPSQDRVCLGMSPSRDHACLLPGADDDGLPDFLADDVPDTQYTPDHVHSSSGDVVLPVFNVSASAVALSVPAFAPGGQGATLTLTVSGLTQVRAQCAT
jgi:hypothetical protein